jgi:rod shape-determining protein MreB
MSEKNFGIDFGTSNVIIYSEEKGIVLEEPAVIAINTETDKLIACGREAYEMIGRAPDSITVIHPLQNGVIAHFEYACMMLRHFMQKVCAYKVIKPRVAISVPASVTAVEQRSFLEAVYAAGARKVMLIEQSMAAAVGAGLDVEAPRGCMVVEMGGGTTDVAVMSLKGVASSCSHRVGGVAFDQAIIRYVRQKYGVIIGEITAENLKKEIGRVNETKENLFATAKGRNAVSGLPSTCEISSADIQEAISEPLSAIIKTIQQVLENTPPELSSDIFDNGILLTGGLAMMRGMTTLISQATGMKCHLAAEPLFCVAKGAAISLRYIHLLNSGVYDIGNFLYQTTETLTN